MEKDDERDGDATQAFDIGTEAILFGRATQRLWMCVARYLLFRSIHSTSFPGGRHLPRGLLTRGATERTGSP